MRGRFVGLASLIILALTPVRASACTGSDCAATLAYEAFAPQQGAKAMAIFLHGSVSSGGAADYMYGHARRFAESHPGVMTVALLAPGYYDRNGKLSAGSDGGRRLKDDTDELIPAIQALRDRFKPKKIVVLGHSKGGANMGGVLVKKPGLASGAVLVAGVYDLEALAAYRNRAQYGPDVIHNIGRIGKATRVLLVHGEIDREVPISQSIAFEKKAKETGVSAKLVMVDNTAHDFNGALSAAAIDALDTLVR